MPVEDCKVVLKFEELRPGDRIWGASDRPDCLYHYIQWWGTIGPEIEYTRLDYNGSIKVKGHSEITNRKNLYFVVSRKLLEGVDAETGLPICP
jgi:hypothetical protein